MAKAGKNDGQTVHFYWTIYKPGSPGTMGHPCPMESSEKTVGKGSPSRISQGDEFLIRLHLRRNDVVLSGRNFTKASPLAGIVGQKAHVIARWGWNLLRWETWDKRLSSAP